MGKMMKYQIGKSIIANFEKNESQNTWLKSICGLECGLNGQVTFKNNVDGMFVLSTRDGGFEGESLKEVKADFNEDMAEFSWIAEDQTVRIDSEWCFCRQTGVISRKDTLTNVSKNDVIITRCLARFGFSPGKYEFYSQNSHWCNENQGVWQPLSHGTVILGCEGGRTTQGGTPYLGLRTEGNTTAVIFHLLPCGNWVIKIKAITVGGDSLPYAVVELGLADENLQFHLASGESFQLPEILIQRASQGQPHLASADLHRYLLSNHFPAQKTIPIVYNTWFDTNDSLNVERLRRQLAVAKEVGCEVFVVDAGWYGAGEGNWFQQVGDWREKQNAAFCGKMVDFAEEVRREGLGFGLWMEPERICAEVPVRKQHPEWFLPGENGQFYPDMVREEVYQYIYGEITRLIETYGLVWMKIDFNFRFGIDPHGTEFSRYYCCWYRLLDELKEKFPEMVFEGCASGGMRLDLNILSHFDFHFLSDNTNPWDVLRISQGASLRLLPGRQGKWLTLRPQKKTGSECDVSSGKNEKQIIVPGGSGATWETSEIADIDFAALVPLSGVFGISGDIDGLSVPIRERLKYFVNLSKKLRHIVNDSTMYLLLPPESKGNRTGWIAIQLYNHEKDVSLLFVYRLEDITDKILLKLYGVDPGKEYHPEVFPDTLKATSVSKVSESGEIEITLPEKNSACCVFIC